MSPLPRPARFSAGLIATIAASALVLQYALLVGATRDTIGPWLATVRFFSYFTILSNLLVLLVTGACAFAVGSRAEGWLGRPVVRGGVALYIAVTMGIYAAILHALWEPQGAQWWADTGLHYAVPALYLLWWLLAVPHGELHWRDLGYWLLFPAAYLCWVLLRGAWLHEYPYPFLDLGLLPLREVSRNCAGVFAFFAVLGAALVLVDRWRGRAKPALAAT